MYSRRFVALANLEDEQLVRAILEGRHEALNTLFERYAPRVFRMARGILGDDGEAEDTTQQVFFECFDALKEFDSSKGTFKKWLLSRAFHRAINRKNHLRAQRFYQWEELDEEKLRSIRSPGILNLSEIEQSRLIQELVSSLRPQEGEVLNFKFFHGLTLQEIAAETHASVSSVTRTLYRALRQLRTYLDNSKSSKIVTRSEIEAKKCR
jgi:RNA polymerase sigma-70 factor (ECF subfamily)